MKTLCLSNFCILSGRWKVDYFFLCLNSFGEWQNWENLSFTLVFQINYLEIERKVISRIFRNIKNNPILARNAKRTKNPWDFNQFAINQNAASFSWKIIFFIPGENKFPRLHRLNVKGFLFGKLQKKSPQQNEVKTFLYRYLLLHITRSDSRISLPNRGTKKEDKLDDTHISKDYNFHPGSASPLLNKKVETLFLLFVVTGCAWLSIRKKVLWSTY